MQAGIISNENNYYLRGGKHAANDPAILVAPRFEFTENIMNIINKKPRSLARIRVQLL